MCQCNNGCPTCYPAPKSNKAHPHAALMLEYAKDAATTDVPWTLWESRHAKNWVSLSEHPYWHTDAEYRRKHVHQALMDQYNEELKANPYAYRNWEFRARNIDSWTGACTRGPEWTPHFEYRRKRPAHVHAALIAQFEEELKTNPDAMLNWEYRSPTSSTWCTSHPAGLCWFPEYLYRRKPAPREFWINEYAFADASGNATTFGKMHPTPERALKLLAGPEDYLRTLHLKEVI